MPEPFLSEAWIVEARGIRAELAGDAVPAANPVRVNLVVRDVPFDPGSVDAHLDTTSGELDVELGHVKGAEVTVTLDYGTAKALVVDQDPQTAMQAFLSGRVKVDGDVSRVLLLVQQAGPDAAGTSTELAERIRAITA